MAVLAEVIHRPAGLEHLQRLLAVGAARNHAKIALAGAAVRHAAAQLKRAAAIRAG